jgi:hypothetical protein
MLGLIGASAITLLAMQAAINAPTEAFRGCLKANSEKATKEKVASDGIDAYLRGACGVEMGTLKDAVVAFRMKNGMGKKAAAEDASMTVDDYVATTVDKYQFMADFNKPKQAPAPAQAQAAAATPAAPATPASAPQPPKQ